MNRIALLFTLWLLGCPAPIIVDGGVVDAGLTEDVCAQQHGETTADGTPVIVCDGLFTSAPWIRLPPDTQSVVYGGVEQGPSFVGRDGVNIAIAGAAWLDRESTFGSMRYAYFLYRAQVAGGVVQEVTPVVRIDDRVFQRLLAGKVLEGGVSARIPDGGIFAYDVRDLGLRIKLDAAPAPFEFDQGVGYPRYALFGRIENAHLRVRASDGGCLPALDSYGARDPLLSATDVGARVTLLRHPGMHAPLDDVFTLDWPEGTSGANNMGGGLFIPAAELLKPTLPSPTEASNSPHGTPWGGPSADLTVVVGGGQSCP